LLAGSGSGAGGSSSRAAGGSSSRSHSTGVAIPSHMLPIQQLTPVQSDASSAGSSFTAGYGHAS
jgi:hypothetical protein